MKLDALIIGGGIAGLWSLATLKRRGYQVILLEKEALGAKQTLACQGIIHGGTKYALTGRLSGAAQAIGAMPARWQAARHGQEAVDLSGVRILSEHQYLWVNHGIGGKLTAFFAGKIMRSRMQRLQGDALPAFLPRDFAGHCYALAEPVLHVPDILAAFARQYQDCILTDCLWRQDGNIVFANGMPLVADYMIYTAGENNAALSRTPGQIRPLRMTALRVGADAPDIYGHCLGTGDKPKLTLTTHPDNAGKVYYIGGQPAEEGVHRAPERQLELVKNLLRHTMPWLPESHLQGQYYSFLINRAEGSNCGSRPDRPVVIQAGKTITAYPTKLAFAPLLAEKIAACLPSPAGYPEAALPGAVRIAAYPWHFSAA